jgi:hypothetical protein
MGAVNQRRTPHGQLWPSRLFDRALRSVEGYNEKVEPIQLELVRAVATF